MPRLIYLAITSLDGYIEDQEGRFDWAAPGDDVHQFINDLMRPVRTYLYGRRMYETMVWWETTTDGDAVHQDFAQIWRAADKVVFSRTLDAPSSERTRIERDFRRDAVRDMVATADGDLAIGGAAIAAEAFDADLVDELHLFVAPHVAGGGKSAYPPHAYPRLSLEEERSFESGMAYLRYRIQHSGRTK